MNLSQEQRLNRVQMAARSDLAKLVYERECRIINRLVAAYRAGSLKPEETLGSIAAISELRQMTTDATHDYALAEEELSQLTAGANHGQES